MSPPWLDLIFLSLLSLLSASGGCELDEVSLEYWALVEEMYNQEQYPDTLFSAAQQMNSQTYETFFKYCACKHDIFIKTETICKYVFHTFNTQQRANTTESNLDIQLPNYEKFLVATLKYLGIRKLALALPATNNWSNFVKVLSKIDIRVIVIKENLLRTFLPFLNKTPTLIVVRPDLLNVKAITENVVGYDNLEWLMEVTSPGQFSSVLAESDLPIDSSLYYYSGDPNLSLTLHDIYRPAPHLNIRTTLCAVWSVRFGLEASPRTRLERRSDLTGVLLRGTSEAESPFILTPPAERAEELSSGQVWREGPGWNQVRVEEFCGEIWSVLQETTNFSFSMVESVDNNWGSKLADGSWNGMVGMIARDEADIGVASFYATADRAEAVDFSVVLKEAEY